ncbi:hypothetical protein C2G38_2212073 [Gigaspora rosea]|uniref:Uncharacterized protein n=1 Tax=Gigaspora rosea TaxID=44941 RepID=A0A397UGD2_9GLOM|nr:hypothetical protein C2G38_2212073 [Gigaspora rosea]
MILVKLLIIVKTIKQINDNKILEILFNLEISVYTNNTNKSVNCHKNKCQLEDEIETSKSSDSEVDLFEYKNFENEGSESDYILRHNILFHREITLFAKFLIYSWIIDLSNLETKRLFTNENWHKISKTVYKQPTIDENIAKALSKFRNIGIWIPFI